MKIAIALTVLVLLSCSRDDSGAVDTRNSGNNYNVTDDRVAEDEYLGRWNATNNDASIRIDEMNPNCRLEYTHGDTSTMCTESSREYRPMDNGFTNIVITCQPDVSHDEFLITVSIADCISDSIWIGLSYDDPSRLRSSDDYIR